MRTYLLFTLLLFISYKVTPQSKNDWALMNLKDQVKKINATEYEMNENTDENKTKYYQIIFNKQGYKLEESLKEADKNQYKSTYKYNNKGKLTEEVTKHTRSTTTRKYTYDEKNKTSTIRFYVSNNALVTKTTQKLDANSNILERHVESEKNNKEKGKLIESYWYQYDDKGNLIEEKQRIDNKIQKIVCKYNENGQKIECNEFNNDGLPTNWAKFQYDDKGNLTEETTAFRGYEPKTINYTYVYDNKGNWIEKRKQLENTTQVLTLREIEYY